ncbi:uncharacterized protein F4822DRAFT_404698 [Hypoxylon trugodes]|uniref:uncharacterized protein n=1 Tax=Hypoxylon trugodes TaxID=326681 RepID=UPI002197C5B4|nr:uncharacterized protein F4822DRAFT_404698 [Hypoxylon trugodes]KAI1389016.1 hypothetical protein F4822DRAFT_404698 [Hypoxylon trugodes]
MKRTIQTAILCFGPSIWNGTRVILMPELHEVGTKPSHIGSPLSVIKNEFGDIVDATVYGMTEDWYASQEGDSEKTRDLDYRGVIARRRIFEWVKGAVTPTAQNPNPNPNPHIAIVTHGHIIRYLLSDPEARGFGNVEYRSYQFSNISADPPELLETQESLQRRGAAKQSDRTERREPPAPPLLPPPETLINQGNLTPAQKKFNENLLNEYYSRVQNSYDNTNIILQGYIQPDVTKKPSESNHVVIQCSPIPFAPPNFVSH